jgi:transposase-like protein
MPRVEFTPYWPKTIERLACPACGQPMWIVRIEPDKPGHDRRTFECADCKHLETFIVKNE